MVFSVTFNNISVISWPSVLLVAETGVHLAMYGIRNHNIVVRTGFLLQQQIIFERCVKCRLESIVIIFQYGIGLYAQVLITLLSVIWQQKYMVQIYSYWPCKG